MLATRQGGPRTTGEFTPRRCRQAANFDDRPAVTLLVGDLPEPSARAQRHIGEPQPARDRHEHACGFQADPVFDRSAARGRPPMTGDDGAAPVLFRASTSDLPARDREAIWREVIGRGMFRFDVVPEPGSPFRSELLAGRLPGLSFFSESATAHRVEKTSSLVAADGSDDI